MEANGRWSTCQLLQNPEAQNGLKDGVKLVGALYDISGAKSGACPETGFDPPHVDKTLVRILARIELCGDPGSRLRGSPVVLAGKIESERRNLKRHPLGLAHRSREFGFG